MVLPYTPEGFVSLNFAMVYIFALKLQRTGAMDDNGGSWSFKVQGNYLAEDSSQFVRVTASQHETTRELWLWPPVRNIIYDEYCDLRLYWETVLSVRRALSSGQLPSSIVDTDGKIVVVPAYFWNSDANNVSDVLQCGRLASFKEHAGPVILLADDLFNWLKATGELPSEGAELPGKVLAPAERVRAYLVQEMRRSPEAPPTQTVRAMRAHCLKTFPGLSVRGFEFAYKSAKAEVPESNWSQRGPRKKFETEFKTVEKPERGERSELSAPVPEPK
jgi:hypothetical protein